MRFVAAPRRVIWPMEASGIDTEESMMYERAIQGLKTGGRPPKYADGGGLYHYHPRQGAKDMRYISTYQSPLGKILLACDETGLTGLWFEGEKYYAFNLDKEYEEREVEAFFKVKKWLDVYFSSKQPGFLPALHIIGTPFQILVWELLLKIPYGKTISYGELAKSVATARNLPRMSAQAVGGAVGHNAISIIIPCHRVVGKDGNLTGYGGGLEKKMALLSHEGVDMKKLFVPKKGTAL